MAPPATRPFSLRRKAGKLVINIADGIPSELVPRVKMEGVDQCGAFELVSVAFPLGRRDAEIVRMEILPLLSACGGAVILPQTHQMVITDRAGVMRTISAVIQAMPEPEPD